MAALLLTTANSSRRIANVSHHLHSGQLTTGWSSVLNQLWHWRYTEALASAIKRRSFQSLMVPSRCIRGGQKKAIDLYNEDQYMMLLDKNTQDWLDISANANPEDAWQALDTRFANTRVVSQTAISEYTKFTPKSKNKHERLIEVAEHVQKTYTQLCSVGKGNEMDSSENLILHVLEWLDKDHCDDLVDIFHKDELAPEA